MTRTRMPIRHGATLLAAAMLLATSLPPAALAHGPTPVLSDRLWTQNQDLRYRFRAGSVPPSRFQTAIRAGAEDSNHTRLAKAAVFSLDASAASLIGYGVNATCGTNGIACFTRTVPDGFTMWFREQGHPFEWGVLRWCQMYDNPPNGCYDVENVALDEFGHVQVLGHHANYADQSDYLDSVVQSLSRTKPNVGWNAHAYGRCDIATLQREYDVLTWSTKYSTCLDIQTDLTLAASRTSVAFLGSSSFTAVLRVVDLDAYDRLGGNPVHGRKVLIQRRPLGSTTWTTVATMTVAATSGSYTYTAQSLTATADWRAVFAKPVDEGIRADTSPVVRVTVAPLCGEELSSVGASLVESEGDCE